MAKYNAIRNHVALARPFFACAFASMHRHHGAFFFVASSFPGFFAWPCRGRMVYITLPADWCAFGFVLTHCDQKNTKFGFQGSGGLPECTCNADPPTASPTEQQHYYGCNPATETMVPIEPEECPSNDELRLINAAGNCTTVPCGALCEGDGECYTELNHPGHVANTTVTENNCWGGFDVYRKVCRDTTADTTEAATTPEPNTTAPVTPAATCPRNCGAAEGRRHLPLHRPLPLLQRRPGTSVLSVLRVNLLQGPPDPERLTGRLELSVPE